MRNYFLLYFVFIFFLATSFASAQQYSSNVGALEQWQLSFDTIKSKVNALLERNNQLSAEYRGLLESQQQAVQAIEDQGAKNESMRQFLKERHGRTDQQVKQEELDAKLKLKKTQLAQRQGQALELKEQLTRLDKMVGLKKIKIADLELRQNMPAPAVVKAPEASSSGDPELDDLRKQLEEQKGEEVKLEDELSSMTQAAQHPEIALLHEKIESLQRQKDELLKGVPVDTASKSSGDIDRKMYFAAIEQKAKLTSKIRKYENQINLLKASSGISVNWAKQKKKLIHDVVQMDARNSQLRERINNLREDIALLKATVGSLQKKINK